MTEAAVAPARPMIADRVGAGIGIVIAVVVIVQSVFYGLQGKGQIIGPGFFPFVLGILLLAIAALWEWQAWRGTVPAPADEIELPDRGGVFRIAVTASVLLLSALLFETLDFRLTIFLAPTIVMIVVFRAGWLRSIATGLAIALVCHFVLLVGLNMPLPTFDF